MSTVEKASNVGTLPFNKQSNSIEAYGGILEIEIFIQAVVIWQNYSNNNSPAKKIYI